MARSRVLSLAAWGRARRDASPARVSGWKLAPADGQLCEPGLETQPPIPEPRSVKQEFLPVLRGDLV